mmetsp:Transcript_23196/g.48263  ORF Transcript_23196/g.48263 Transcript_23196/m.48263 type:complete len:431 (-) Transcript_23196:328-1620(-)|eukprot:CAMPEP_0172448430 /NCGR_PEP_ID=MMETSP1065-20121228/7451_1 /TAXON_ID=265537 /ORGANISM="Amphiprora paludosa, Strain CCMP125" /LENGTH=430 /DNA_ID=CAMNT_0013199921 /DNA_START=563 /DNA_END=1855 /DNA_ORIENTATION=+
MTESIFARASSCYTCGIEETFAFDSTSATMQRASVSRRQSGTTSSQSYVRSRSEERSRNADESLRELENELHNQQEQVALGKTRTMDSTNSIEEDRVTNGQGDDDEFHDAVAEPPAEDAGSPREKIHRRAMSDPFDTPLSDRDMEDIRQLEQEAEAAEQEQHAAANANVTAPLAVKKPNGYPTLPRYPVAVSQDKNCWSEPPLSIYSVRGPNYAKDKKKVPSKEYLMPAIGCDLFLMEDESLDIGSRTSQILNGHLRTSPALAINFRFPWGSMILYFGIPAKLGKYVGQSSKQAVPSDFTNAEKVLANWLQGDTDYKNERLKLIPYVAEGPWVVRNMVTGRPAIIGKKLPVTYSSLPEENGLAPLCVCTLDIGSSSATAKRIVSVCRRYMSALTVDIGFVIQGDSADELPEQMLGSTRIHGVDPLKAPKL